ncbi:MAG: histidinol-phosphate aminotransferase [Methanoculleus sp. SDB]|nr:MAG: histidinol-phosphate aminotransferase [Methanoculleus sp. SDB]
MKHLVRDIFRTEGYVFATKAREIAASHGHKHPALLASNENPFPPSSLALEAASRALSTVQRYPDERNEALREALTHHYGGYRFVTGAGMDGIIETIIRVLISPGDSVAVSQPTFSFYGIAARAQGAEVMPVQRDADFTVDPDTFIRAARGAKIAFVCSPNNPTGNATPASVIGEIAEGIDGILFLDNAYVEFSGEDYLPLMKRYDNILIGRTFSKAYALAGLRIGYAFVPEWLEPYYRRAETPFALNSVSSAAAAAALGDRGHTDAIITHVTEWRARMTGECRFPVFPSSANFILIDVAPMTGEEAVEALAARGVIVRSCSSFPGLDDHYVRVSVGTTWENEMFLTEVNRL